MPEIDFMGLLHKSTKRDYLARVNDEEYPKAKAAELAKKFDQIFPSQFESAQWRAIENYHFISTNSRGK